LLAEVVQHRLVNGELRLHSRPAGELAADARVAFGGEALREARELLAAEQRSSEPRRIESARVVRPHWTDDALVGLDATAAVDGTPRVGVLQLARRVGTFF